MLRMLRKRVCLLLRLRLRMSGMRWAWEQMPTVRASSLMGREGSDFGRPAALMASLTARPRSRTGPGGPSRRS